MGFVFLNPALAFSNGPAKVSGITCIETLINNYSISIARINFQSENLEQNSYNFVDGLAGLGGISGIENKDKDGGEVNFKPHSQDKDTVSSFLEKEQNLKEAYSSSSYYLDNNCKKTRQLFLHYRILII